MNKARRKKFRSRPLVERLEPRVVLSGISAGIGLGLAKDVHGIDPPARHNHDPVRPPSLGAGFGDHAPRDGVRGKAPPVVSRNTLGERVHQEVHRGRQGGAHSEHPRGTFADDPSVAQTIVTFIPLPTTNFAVQPPVPRVGVATPAVHLPTAGQPAPTVSEFSPLFAGSPDRSLEPRAGSTAIEPLFSGVGRRRDPSLADRPAVAPVPADVIDTFSERAPIDSGLIGSGLITSGLITSGLSDSSLPPSVEVGQQESSGTPPTAILLPAGWQSATEASVDAWARQVALLSPEPANRGDSLSELPDEAVDRRSVSINHVGALDEGGLIEIETHVAAVSSDKMAAREEQGRAADSPAIDDWDAARLLRDEFWRYFADGDFDIERDESQQAIGGLGEVPGSEPETTQAAVAAWDEFGIDEGGMIALISGAIADDATAEAAIAETPFVEHVEVPIEPGIGVFQAVEVATPSEDSPEGSAEEVATSSENAGGESTSSPSPERSARVSGLGEPRRGAASISFVITLARLFPRDRRNRRKGDQECDIHSC